MNYLLVLLSLSRHWTRVLGHMFGHSTALLFCAAHVLNLWLSMLNVPIMVTFTE